MLPKAAYLLVAFLAAFPVLVSFVRCRAAAFKDVKLLFETGVYFLFFIWCSVYAYFRAEGEQIVFFINIFCPFFLLFLIQSELGYRIKKNRILSLLIPLLLNAFLQILINSALPQNFYGLDLWKLLANFFSVFAVLKLDKEYARTAYIPNFSVRILAFISIPCLLADFYPFCVLFVAQVFFLYSEKRLRELREPQKDIDLLKDELNNFQDLIEEFSTSIKDFSDRKKALKQYLLTLGNFLEAKGAAIYEWNSEKKCFYCTEVSGLYFPFQISNEKLLTKPEVLREIALKQRISDPNSLVWKYGHSGSESGGSGDESCILLNVSKEIRSAILFPLLQEKELLGVLVLQNKTDNGYFTDAEFRTVKSFAYLASIILNTSKMIEQRNENLRMSLELNAGNIVQSALFSQEIPQMEDIELFAFTQPAKEIGGDYYDFIVQKDKIGIVIGDVSGKGVAAGILVAIIQTYLQNKYQHAESIKSLVVDMNIYLSQKIKIGMFITMLLFEWEPAERRLRYVSCGHEHILHYHAKNKSLECIRSGGLAVMMDEDIEPYLEEKELRIESGDSIVLYTDGVTETFNANRELFGLDRFIEFVRKNSPLNAKTFGELLPETLAKWRGETEQTDDITCLLMRF